MTDPKILVLFSGGLDSTVLLAWALRNGRAATLTFDRPDRPRGERRAAAKVLRHYGVKERYVLPYPEPVQTWVEGAERRGRIPGRNLFHLAAAFLLAPKVRANIVAAAHLKTDGESFPDARPEFLRSVERLANEAESSRNRPLRLGTPFLHLAKADVVWLARRWEIPLDLTWSCYRDGARPCRRCAACQERESALNRGARPGRPPPSSRSGPILPGP